MESRPWECIRCVKPFATKQKLINHIRCACKGAGAPPEEVESFIRDMSSSKGGHACQFCDRKYTQRSNRCRHEKQCKAAQEGKYCAININGDHNTVTVNMSIVPHGHEDIGSIITLEWLKSLRLMYANETILTAVKNIHFNESRPECMNVYISNIKDKVCRVFTTMGIWMKADMDETVENTYDKVVNAIQSVLDALEDPSELSGFSHTWDSFLERDRAVETVKGGIRELMTDLKDFVKKVHMIGAWAKMK